MTGSDQRQLEGRAGLAAIGSGRLDARHHDGVMGCHHPHDERLANAIEHLAEPQAQAEVECMTANGFGKQGRFVHELIAPAAVAAHCNLKELPVGVPGKDRQQCVELAGGWIQSLDVTHKILRARFLPWKSKLPARLGKAMSPFAGTTMVTSMTGECTSAFNDN